MNRRSLIFVTAALLASLGWGCHDGLDGGEYPPPPYPSQLTPEHVVASLQAAYMRREIEQYARLLDPAFIFKFQTADVPIGLPRDYWNRDEDSAGTGALFGAVTEVSRISMDLGAFATEDANRPDEPGAKRIRLTHAKLEVEQIDGVTLLVEGDIQDMYFRRGSVEAGTDSTKWYLFEWHDLRGGYDSPGSHSERGADPQASTPATHVVTATWGKVKQEYK